MKVLTPADYRRWLRLILAVYFLLTIVNTAATPLMRGPDEPAHIIYVRSLAHLRFPVLTHQETRNIEAVESHEAHQPPLYYLLAAGPYRIAESLTGSVHPAARTVRAFSMLLGLVWVYLISRLAQDFFGKSVRALWTAAFAAFIPMSTYMAGVVNNDIMICTTFTWALWILLAAIKRRFLTRRAGVWLGTATGLAMLSKAQGLFLPPLTILVTLLALPSDRESRRQMLQSVAIAFAMGAALASWWPIRNLMVYGQPFLQSLYHPIISPEQFLGNIIYGIRLVSVVTAHLFQYFWAPFWVVDQMVKVIPRLYWAISAAFSAVMLTVWAFGMLGLLIRFFNPRKKEIGTTGTEARVYVLFIAAAAMIYLSVVYQTLFVDQGVLQQGRLFLPTASALGILMVQGYTAIFRGRTTRRVLAAAGIITLLALNLLFSYAIYYNYRYVEIASIAGLRTATTGYPIPSSGQPQGDGYPDIPIRMAYPLTADR